MKRIRVPEGMLRAAFDVNAQFCSDALSVLRRRLEAALLWLSEHPQVPTDEQWNELLKEFPPCDFLKTYGFAQIFAEWQRRCFVQEEPEIPEEIKDLLDMYGGEVGKSLNFAVQEAYRRGLRKEEQK